MLTDILDLVAPADHRFTALRSILQFAKREGIVTRNVASGRDSNINPPRPQRHVFCIFSMSEAKQLMLALKDEPLWFQIAVFLGLMFGLRRSEVLGLRAVDVDFENNSFNICFTITQQTVDGKNTLVARPFTKNRRIKNFSLDPADAQHTMDLIAELLCSHEENRIRFGADYDEAWSDFFMRYPDGKLVPPNALTNHFAKFVAKNGFKKIRFHDLRHPYVKHTTKNISLQKQKSQTTNRFDSLGFLFPLLALYEILIMKMPDTDWHFHYGFSRLLSSQFNGLVY